MNGADCLEAWGFPASRVIQVWRASALPTTGNPERFGKHGAVWWDEIIAAAAVRAEVLTVHQKGILVPAAGYSRSAVIGGAELSGLLDQEALARLDGAGATVVAANIEQYLAEAAACAAALGRYFGAAVEAHAFRTPPGCVGIPVHADREDNFLLQLNGRKRWRLWAPQPELRIHYRREELGTPAAEIELCAGGALYIPSGLAAPRPGRP